MKDFILVFGAVMVCIVVETVTSIDLKGGELPSFQLIKEHALMYLLFIGVGVMVFFLRRNSRK